jgi:hypothetical protein
MHRALGMPSKERNIFIDNLLVRVHLIIEMSRPALRHGSLNSLFQVGLYLPTSASRCWASSAGVNKRMP